jgi:hypothetical protein
MSVPLGHTAVHTFKAAVEVGYHPTRMDAERLLVLAIRPNIGWADDDELTDLVPPTSEIHQSNLGLNR